MHETILNGIIIKSNKTMKYYLISSYKVVPERSTKRKSVHL